jgi:hypothetical protein
MEWWNIGKSKIPSLAGLLFKRKFLINKLPVQSRSQQDQYFIIPFSQNPLFLPRETFSYFTGAIIPVFQYSPAVAG